MPESPSIQTGGREYGDLVGARNTVLWCHSHFLLPTGGTKYIYEVARRLAQTRPVEMVVERASDYWRERYRDVGVPLHEIASATSTSKLYWLTFPRHVRRDQHELKRLIDVTRADALVSSFFPMNTLCSRLGQELGLGHTHLCYEPFPFFHDREVTALYPATSRALMKLLARLYGHLDREGVLGADEVLTLNEVTRASIERTYGRADAEPVYAGIDHAHFRPYGDDELGDLRERHGAGPIAVHSTDFSPIKRTDLALRAFAAAGHRQARMLITSTIEDKDGLAAMMRDAERLGIADQVEYLGFVAYEDLPRYYALADVLMQTGTSLNSGATSMSLPVKEGLACGTAVIRARATDEDVVDGVSGFLVDPADSAETGARLAELLNDPRRAARLGAAGHERMADLYSWEKVVTHFEQAIERSAHKYTGAGAGVMA